MCLLNICNYEKCQNVKFCEQKNQIASFKFIEVEYMGIRLRLKKNKKLVRERKGKNEKQIERNNGYGQIQASSILIFFVSFFKLSINSKNIHFQIRCLVLKHKLNPHSNQIFQTINQIFYEIASIILTF